MNSKVRNIIEYLCVLGIALLFPNWKGIITLIIVAIYGILNYIDGMEN